MCGIAGMFHYQASQPVDPLLLRRMCDAIRHRGPDDEGYFVDQHTRVALGHRRLSIVDLTTGQQPMSNVAKTTWVVFNGEIYNYPALRDELQAKGYTFRTASDTEAIIAMYDVYGEAAFSRLNGMFAFALYDHMQRTLMLARDPFGVKPLYYYLGQGKLVFASEMKAIFQDPSISKALDLDALNSFLTFRYNPSPQTLFTKIRKLAPGYCLKVRFEGADILQSYIREAPPSTRRITDDDAVEMYQTLVEQAVRRQMMSDVPVGLLLSGGVDSAVLGMLMRGVASTPIKTFTIGFPGSGDHNELDDARATARLIGAEHHEFTMSQAEYLEIFCDSFRYTEEPIAETTIPALYGVARLAAQHVKVVLAGQGADEPLAGYHRYLGAHLIGQYGPLLRALPLKTIAQWLPRNERFKRAIHVSQFHDEISRLLGLYTIFTPEHKRLLVRHEMFADGTVTDQGLIQQWHSRTGGLSEALSRMLYIDTRMSLPDNLLLFNDKMTMANSLEMRVPFLDLELIRFVESLPVSLKLRGLQRKFIHKKAAQRWLPKETVYRKKRGFATPMDAWLQSDLATSVSRLIHQPDSACRKFFHVEYIEAMIRLHQTRKENYQRQIFALLSFECWYRTWVDEAAIDRDVFLTRPHQVSIA